MKKHAIMFFCVTVALIFAFLATDSLAWFRNVSPLSPNLGMSAGGYEDFSVYRLTFSNDSPPVRICTETGEVGSEFSVSNLELGNITNLSFLENSNIVYYVVRIPVDNGANVSFGVSYGDVDSDGDHFNIYVPVRDEDGYIDKDSNGAMITTLYTDEANLENIVGIETGNDDTFLHYDFALSTMDPTTADCADVEALFDGSTSKSLNDTEDDGVPSLESTSFDFSTLEEGAQYYYAYVKFEPNISLYKYFIDYLYEHMPFCLAYEVRVVLEVQE